MSATNKTTNYNLPLFVGTDVPTWLGDWNGAMTSIDAAIHQAAQTGGGGSTVTIVQGTGSSTTAVMSQNAATQAFATAASVSNKQDQLVSGTNLKTINGNSLLGSGDLTISGGGSSVSVVQSTGTSTTSVMSQNAVTQALSTTNTSVQGKQDALVSGTNIKTVNGQSILGSGDLTISGGSANLTMTTYNLTQSDMTNLSNLSIASDGVQGQIIKIGNILFIQAYITSTVPNVNVGSIGVDISLSNFLTTNSLTMNATPISYPIVDCEVQRGQAGDNPTLWTDKSIAAVSGASKYVRLYMKTGTTGASNRGGYAWFTVQGIVGTVQ